jgi:hypothetical protein
VTSIERAAFSAAFLAAVLWGKAGARLRSLRPSRRGCRDCARWKTALEEARRPLPAADRAPEEPVLPEKERARLADLRSWREEVSAGQLEIGTRLANDLRVDMPGVPGAVIARVLLRVGAYADFVSEEQGGDPHDAWTVLIDSIAVAAPDLAAMELELTEGRGR